MTSRTSWPARIAVLLAWMVLTAGIAFLAGRMAADNAPSDGVTDPLPPVAIGQRATVSLAEAQIVQVVSASGVVVQGSDGWFLEAPAGSDELAYRLLDPPLGVKAMIKGGPSGFACSWIGLGQSGVGAGGDANVASASELPPGATGVTMRCAIPAEVRVVAGMNGMMVLQMGKPSTVSALPLTAVVGTASQGQVVVVHGNGTTELRTVGLGISDIYNIEVTGGLAPSDVVLRNPTQSDFAASQSPS